MPMGLYNSLKITTILCVLSSCTSFLPEFERVEALEKGKHRLAAGAYGGARLTILDGGLLDGYNVVETNVGGAGFHSVGLSNNIAWSSTVTTGLIYDEFRGSELQYSLTTGPKVSIAQTAAITCPVHLTNVQIDPTFEGIHLNYLLPTIYVKDMLFAPMTGWSGTMYLRAELPFDSENIGFGMLIGGYKLENQNSPHRPSINVNFTLLGAYLGYTVDLIP